MKALLTFFALTATVFVNAANINMPVTGLTGTTAGCGDVFRDDGGTGNYANNANAIYTICPATVGNRLVFTFTAFALENNDDFLYIYDGSSTAGNLIGVYTGTTSPGTVTAGTTGGCITFRFMSDNNNPAAGWSANISCLAACQTITANFVSSSPVPDAASIIKACQGDAVSFTGNGIFSSSSAGASYVWSFGDGTTATGNTVTKTYPSGGAYTVNLTITDPSGCKNANFINRIVQIATTPSITTSATPSPLCTNQFAHLTGNATATANVNNCAVPVAGTTYLPDINGGYYHTDIPVSCYTPGSLFTAASNLSSVCLNMEHSYVGDLNILLRCPNGQSVVLKAYNTALSGSGGGARHLGVPIETDGTGPGTGWNYCFTPTATTYLVNGATTNIGGGNVSINAGSYRPSQPFTGLIGCPMNGNWEIEIADNLAVDDGYIFSWSINFDPAILPASQTFTPTIVSQGWTPSVYLYNLITNQADVVAPILGTFPYAYVVTDNFGCSYSANQNVVVNCLSLPAGLVSFNAKALADKRVELRWITESEHNTGRFEIDRSADGQNWEFVTAAQAAGESETELVYSSYDTDPHIGISYYRLRTIDNDGAQKVSDIDVVTINPEEGVLLIYPNPSNDIITIEGNESDLSALKLLNAIGQDVSAAVSVNNKLASKLQIDLSPLARGTYLVKTPTTTYKVVKN